MSQHDYILADAAGAAFRTDLNLALGATVSRNSGASAPATTYPYMEWMDTTSGFRKVRNAANSAWIICEPLTSPLVTSTGIRGSTLSNNVTDATNDIDIAAGACADATLAVWMVGAALTKRLDANWAVGTNQGMLDTGAIANNTYHIWRIMRSDTGVVDILASLSATAPTMPANYDYKRRIGSIVRTGAAIKAFKQNGDLFQWVTAVQDIAGAANTAVTARTLTLPTGIKVEAWLSIFPYSDTASHNSVTDPDVNSTAASGTNSVCFQPSATNTGSWSGYVMTNTSAQVNTDSNGTNATITISTFGYKDRRDI